MGKFNIRQAAGSMFIGFRNFLANAFRLLKDGLCVAGITIKPITKADLIVSILDIVLSFVMRHKPPVGRYSVEVFGFMQINFTFEIISIVNREPLLLFCQSVEKRQS